VARVTVHHLTPVRNLPLIEEDGLRTRADLSGHLGPVDAFDQAAPGTYANGKRVSAWLSLDHAREHVAASGPGLVTFSVDPRKTLAAPASTRDGADPADYWAATRPLADWQADGELPDDLEVHTNLPVRAKYVQLRAPLVTDDELGEYATLVAAVADEDRLSAKALMHLAVIASEGDFDSTDFVAACALAWRDEPDPPALVRELMETDPDKVASAALAEHGAAAPEVTGKLRQVLDETREWADEQGLDHGRGLFARTAAVLDTLDA
jgi:hypothetical protein